MRGIAAGVFLLSLTLTGCSTTLQRPTVSGEAIAQEREKQLELSFNTEKARTDRLFRVWHSIASTSSDLCGNNVEPLGGFIFHSKETYQGESGTFTSVSYIEYAQRHYNLEDSFTVTYIDSQFPAGRAGLQMKDRLLAVNGASLVEKSRSSVVDLLKTAGQAGPVTLTISRDSKVSDISYSAIVACSYPVVLVHNDAVAAYSDGRNIYVTTGILRFLQGDDELAVVLGHELAHNNLNHNSFGRKLGKVLMGQGLLGKALMSSSSQEIEAEADYAGLYSTSRAGYAIGSAPALWRRMAMEHPESITSNFGATHPTSPERFVLLEATVKEISEKQAKGLPLVPEKK
jgi:hypothetical protein